MIRDFYWKTPLTKLYENHVLIGQSKGHHGQGEEQMPQYMHILTPAHFFQNE